MLEAGRLSPINQLLPSSQPDSGHTAHPALLLNMKSKSLEHEDSRVNQSFDGV